MSVVRKIAIRHRSAPVPNGCRWCGCERLGHAQRWVPSARWHGWVEPTDAQRKARMWRRRAALLNSPWLQQLWDLRAGRKWLP